MLGQHTNSIINDETEYKTTVTGRLPDAEKRPMPPPHREPTEGIDKKERAWCLRQLRLSTIFLILKKCGFQFSYSLNMVSVAYIQILDVTTQSCWTIRVINIPKFAN